MSRMRIGVDLGGTKIEAISLDGSRETGRIRVATPRDDYPSTLEAIVSIVNTLEGAASGRGTVGIGIPGTLSPSTGLVKNANSVWLIGKPLLVDLETRLGRRVRIANDANCFAVSEATDGAAAGADVVFGVIVGTGTGAGIVVRGDVMIGPNGIAGEWGHNAMPWPDHAGEGPACYCGKRGCIETYLSGPGMTADHERLTGQRRPPEQIIASAAAGEAAANETLARYERRMARALASIINVLDPDVIVLGGGMSNIDRLYEQVPRIWGEYVFAAGAAFGHADLVEPVRTRLVRARHGDSSGVRGAAWLWPDETDTSSRRSVSTE